MPRYQDSDRFGPPQGRGPDDGYVQTNGWRGGRYRAPPAMRGGAGLGEFEQQRQNRGRSGLAVFDKTLQTTHIWLNEIMDEIGPDRQHAWKVLSVVLHHLRDRLPIPLAAHLGAQLPLLIRGVYYDQFRPGRQPTDLNLVELVTKIDDWLADTRPTDPREALRAVFRTLSRHIPLGEIENVQDALPRDLRDFWIACEEDVVPPPMVRRRRSRAREQWPS